MDAHAPFLRFFRERGLAHFWHCFPESGCRTVLDVGGTLFIWKFLSYDAKITLLNQDEQQNAGFTSVIRDARQLAYSGGSFDFAFSNSVIEHIASEDQKSMANELRRVR